MQKTRSSDRRQEKAEMKVTKPHSIVKNAAAASAAATKSIISKKNQKQTAEDGKSSSSVLRQRVEVGGTAAKPSRFGSTVISDKSAKITKSFAENDDLMEVTKVKSSKNAPNIKVELESEVNNLHFTFIAANEERLSLKSMPPAIISCAQCFCFCLSRRLVWHRKNRKRLCRPPRNDAIKESVNR